MKLCPIHRVAKVTIVVQVSGQIWLELGLCPLCMASPPERKEAKESNPQKKNEK